MSSLDSSLLDIPISTTTKDSIARHLWGTNTTQQQLNPTSLDLRAYWFYYSEECSHALHDAGRHISARTHRNILNIAHQFKGPILREDLRWSLKPALSNPSSCNEDEVLDSSIDLAARLLLMLDFGNLQYGFSGHSQLDWNKGTFKDFIQPATLNFSFKKVDQQRIFPGSPSVCPNGPGFYKPALPVDDSKRSPTSKAAAKPSGWNESRDMRTFDPDRWLIGKDGGNGKLQFDGNSGLDGISHRAVQCYVKLEEI
jgi:hypothetical protein